MAERSEIWYGRRFSDVSCRNGRNTEACILKWYSLAALIDLPPAGANSSLSDTACNAEKQRRNSVRVKLHAKTSALRCLVLIYRDFRILGSFVHGSRRKFLSNDNVCACQETRQVTKIFILVKSS